MTLTPHPHRSSSVQYSGGFSCTVISRAASGGCGSQRVSFAGEEEEQVPSEAENVAQEDAPLVTNLRKGIWPKRPEVRISIAVQTYRVPPLPFILPLLLPSISCFGFHQTPVLFHLSSTHFKDTCTHPQAAPQHQCSKPLCSLFQSHTPMLTLPPHQHRRLHTFTAVPYCPKRPTALNLHSPLTQTCTL